MMPLESSVTVIKTACLSSVKSRILVLLASLFLVGCSDDSWYCVEDGERMYSRSTTGEWGGAKRGCSCSEIRSFEKRIFGEVDEAALKRDFGC
jgi:hypothetical protein